MSTTNILDVKDIPELPGADVTEDGHRHIDLDALFHEELRTDDRSAHALPGTVVTVRPFSRLKLAGNARVHSSRALGTDITLHDFFTFTGWDADNYGPVAGTMTRGPYMRATKLPASIAAFDDGNGPEEVALLVEEGDTVTFLGSQFRVAFPSHSNRNMALELLEEPLAA